LLGLGFHRERPVQLGAGAQAAPVLDDLPVPDSPGLHVLDGHDATRRRDAQDLADVAEPLSRPVDHQIVLGDEVTGQRFQVRERAEEAVLARPAVARSPSHVCDQ
jgi:hypothetical protein